MLFALLGLSQLLMASESGESLFKYPQVPDTISTLDKRANYFVSNFWENLDLTKQIKDKEAFKAAFVDYITFFPYADGKVVENSLNKLLYKTQGNSSNFRLLAESAELAFYGANPVMKSDGTYHYILTKIVASNRLSTTEKLRYQTQINILFNNRLGVEAQEFKYKNLAGRSKKFGKFDSDYTILYINDPDCEDCVIGRLRLSVDVELNRLIEQGKVTFYSISLCEYSKEWAEKAKEYSKTWEIGATSEIFDLYDLRLTPNLYIMDKDGVILAKNVAKISDILSIVK